MTTTEPLLLIHAHDPLIAALLGTMLEQEGARAVFCERDEPVEAAAKRIRPQLIIADVAATQRDAVAHVEVARTSLDHVAATLGATVVLFGTPEDCAILRESGYDCYALPDQREALRARVEALLHQHGGGNPAPV
jgi:DNA-binding response OmpR family regulator